MYRYTVKVYNENTLMSEITVEGQSVTFTNYSDKAYLLPFGVKTKATREDLDEYYEERSFPKDRENCKLILRGLDLDFYEPELICRKTHGQQFDDFIWLQFSDEPQVTYEEIRLR